MGVAKTGEVDMKREMDLARPILPVFPFDGSEAKVNLPGASGVALQCHLLLLTEAGLIDSIRRKGAGGGCIRRQIPSNGVRVL